VSFFIYDFQNPLVGQAATLQIDIYLRSPREISKAVISHGKFVVFVVKYF